VQGSTLLKDSFLKGDKITLARVFYLEYHISQDDDGNGTLICVDTERKVTIFQGANEGTRNDKIPPN